MSVAMHPTPLIPTDVKGAVRQLGRRVRNVSKPEKDEMRNKKLKWESESRNLLREEREERNMMCIMWQREEYRSHKEVHDKLQGD
jgi:hypothetical protein